jgi:cell fate (sporulation/competence/biofilm development) regulator YmcA (YheA/YmcA/DUF963 family)
MDIMILDKVDTIINHIDNSNTIKQYKILKDKINNDAEAKELLNDYNNVKKLNNTSLLVDKKRALFNNSLLKEYLSFEKDIHYLILTLSHKLSSLVDTKQCKNPTNL